MRNKYLLSVIFALLFITSRAQVITVPVVFHIVYNTTAQNVADSFLLQAIQVMNQDFRKQNSDTVNIPSVWKSLAADCEIEFCLAQQDPQGNPTNGITRTPTTTTQWICNNEVMHTAMGGEDIWDRTKYFNIWVCKIFPAQVYCPSVQYFNAVSNEDGAVVDFTILRKQSPGGHWNEQKICSNAAAEYLNLYSFYKCAAVCADCDSVSDTPNDTMGCAGLCTLVDPCNPNPPGVMCANYMSGADDACRYFFTYGQKARMRACLSGPRASLLSSGVCLPVGIEENNLFSNIKISPNPSNGKFMIQSPEIILDIGVTNIVGEKIYISTIRPTKSEIDLSKQPDGIYFLQLKTAEGIATKKIILSK